MQNTSGVCFFQRTGDLEGQFGHFLRRQGAAEWPAFDVLHHQVIRADVVDLANVWMIQCGDRARLLLESCAMLVLEALDRDNAIEPCVARLPHLAHAPCAEKLQDRVGPELCARSHFFKPACQLETMVRGCVIALSAPGGSSIKNRWPSEDTS